MTGATNRQAEILAFIDARIGNGLPPTIREICEHFGIRSTNGTAEHVQALIRKGLLERIRVKARAMRVTPKGKREIAASGLHVRSTGAEVFHG